VLLTFAAHFLKGGHDVIPELRDQSGSARGAQARLAYNGRAQDGLVSAGETVQGLVINGLTLG
jgi:hypothetical protein